MKIGLIGINSSKEEKSFESIQQSLKSNILGIFSPNTEEMHAFAQKYDIKKYPSATTLFQDVDAVYFANSLKPNVDFAIHAIKNSCHLFIENIFDLSTEEVKQLFKLAFEAEVQIAIKQTILYTPEFKLIKKELQQTKYVEMDCSFNQILRKKDYFFEIFEAVRFVSACINSGIKKINTTPVKIDETIFSFVFIFLEFDNGSIAKIKLNNLSQENEKQIRIYEVHDFYEINLNKHFVYKHTFSKGHTERRELGLFHSNPFESEISSFIHYSEDIKSLNISESPEIIQDIQATQSIINKIYS